jgi:hypothetical protein
MSVNPEYVEGTRPLRPVRDATRSTAFHERFGFKVHNIYEQDGGQVRCWLERRNRTESTWV